MAEPVNVGINVVGDARSGVRAFDDTTAAARRTEQQVQNLAATVQKAQNAWAAPAPGTGVAGGLQPGVGVGPLGRILAQGGLQDVLGGATANLPSGVGSLVYALGSLGSIGTILAEFAALAGVIAGIGKELDAVGNTYDKYFGPQHGDPRTATNAAEAARDIRNAGVTSEVGDITKAAKGLITGGILGLARSSPAQRHKDAMRKMIDGMDPGELLAVIPQLTGDDQAYAQQAYQKAMQRHDFQASWSGATGRAVNPPTAIVFNTAVLGSTQEAQSIIQRAQRNNGSQTTITAPRAP